MSEVCPVPVPSDVNLVLYHADCMDGFAAAWAAYHLLKDKAEYIPVKYQEDPPDVTGRDVVIVDFCYKRPVLDAMVHSASSLMVIDHHKSAIEEIKELRWEEKHGGCTLSCHRPAFKNAILNTYQSGCILTWEWFHPSEEAPHIFRYIQDRDLWRWHLLYSREINIALYSYPMDFATFDAFGANGDASTITNLIAEGTSICRYHQKIVDIHVDKHRLGRFASGKIPVAVAHATTKAFTSDIGEKLWNLYPDRVAVVWFYNIHTGRYEYSLRARPGDGHDVSAIAEEYGGGGHKGAAGFKSGIPIEELVEWDG